MGKGLITLVVVGLLGVSTAMAQDNGSAANQNAQQPSYNQSTTTTTPTQSSPSDNGGQSASTLPPSTQSAMSNGATQTSNGGAQTVEGCLMKEQTSYFIQPENGGARTQLSPSRSLDSYVGQHVSVVGGPSDSGSGLLMVTGVKTISTTCSPATVPSH